MPRSKKSNHADSTPSLAYCPNCRGTTRVTRDRFITRADGSRIERLLCLKCRKSFQRKRDYKYRMQRRRSNPRT